MEHVTTRKTNAERVRAAKLRRQVAAGAELDGADRAWLEAYEASRSPRGTKRPPAPSSSSSARVPGLLSVPDVTAAPVAEAVPMLPAAAPAEGAPPPEDGKPAPDEPVVTNEAPGPTEAELAAGGEKLAFGIIALAQLGIGAALELAPADLPYLEHLQNAEVQGKALAYVGECAKRVAVKYGLTMHVPMEDELVCAAVVAGSVAALVARQRRRAEAPGPMTDAVRNARDVTPPPADMKPGAWDAFLEGK